MNDAFDDRLIEIGLEEILGGLRPPDLRGVLGLEEPGTPRGVRRGRLVAAAAVVLVALGALLFFTQAPAERPVLLRADRLTTLVDPDGNVRKSSVIRAGDRIVTTEGELSLPAAGGTIDLRVGSVLEIRGSDRARLHAGAATVTAERAAVLETPLGEAVLDEGTRAEVVLVPHAPVDLAVLPGIARDLPAPHRVRLEISRGAAHWGEGQAALVARSDQSLRVFADGRKRSDPVLNEDRRRHLSSKLESALLSADDLDLQTLRDRDRLAASVESARYVKAMVGDDPRAADHLRFELLARLGSPLPDDVRTRLLRILVEDDDPRARAHLLRVIGDAPALVATETLLRLADAGEDRAQRLLRERFASNTATKEVALLIALHFAFRDDAIGRELLERAGAVPFDEDEPHRSAAVAAARARLGTPNAWPAYVSALSTWVEAALSSGDISGARVAVRCAAYVAPALSGDAPRVANLAGEVFAFAKRWDVPVETAADVRAALAGLPR